MKTDKKTIKAVKHLLSNDLHSKHHLKIELTKNLLPHIFESEKEAEFVITPGQIESLELENNELKRLVENLKAEKEIILRGSPNNRKITDVKLPLAGEDLFYITKQQIKIIQDSRELEEVKYITKEWFPEAFKEDKKELEVGKWYKCIEKGFESLIVITDLEGNKAYGFSYYGENDRNIWNNESNCGWSFKSDTKNWELATEEEVTEALTKEAVKRGYKNGNHICLDSSITEKKVADIYEFEEGKLWYGNEAAANCVFKDGIWAQVFETITKEQAEKELGKKII